MESQNLNLQKQLESSVFKERANQMSNLTLTKIFKDLNQNNIQISKEKKPFLLKQSKIQVSPRKLEEMRKKKQLVQRQLKYIQLQQSKLKQSQISNTTYNKFRSQFSKEELIKIRQIIKNQNNFIKTLQEKQKMYYESLENYRKQKLALQEKFKMEKCQQRVKEISIKMQDLIKLQQQRKLKFKLDQERLQKVRKENKLHQQLQKKWNEKQKLQQQKIKAYTQNLRKQNKFNLEDINKHHKNYDQVTKEKEQLRIAKNIQFKNKQRLNLPKILPSKFFNQLKSQQQIKKAQEQKKLMEKQELILKKEQYNTLVKQKFKPRVKTNKQFQTQQEQINKKSPLMLGEIINLGNDYMKQVHTKIRNVHRSQQKIATAYYEKSQKPLYKNYLNDLKSRHNKQNKSENKLQEIKKLMSDVTLSESQKIQKAKLIAKTLQKKQHQNKGLIKSINAKLQILNQISK